jgi:hypothetical protein
LQAGTAAMGGGHRSVNVASDEKGVTDTTWTCNVCTYAGNTRAFLRYVLARPVDEAVWALVGGCVMMSYSVPRLAYKPALWQRVISQL